MGDMVKIEPEAEVPLREENAKPKWSMDSFLRHLNVFVGVEKKKFVLEKSSIDKICAHSGYFSFACRVESPSSININLEGLKPVIFSLFLTWVLTGDIKNAAEYMDSDMWTEEQETEDNQLAMQLTDCYALGTVLVAEGFCNMIMDLFIAKAKCINDKFQSLYGTGVTNIEHIWGTSTSTSPLRRMMLDLNISGDAQFGEEDGTAYSPALQTFYHDLAVAAIGAYHGYSEIDGGIQFPWDGDICRYHIHSGKRRDFSCIKSTG